MGIDERESAEVDDEARVSFAAYFGAATGLVVGLVLAMIGAAWLDQLRPDSRMAEVFWEVASPLLAVLGFLGGGLLFHRHLRGRTALPAILFLIAFLLGAWLAYGPVGFPWKAPP